MCAALATSVLSLVLAPSAFANFITPKAGGSPNANQIHSLYMIILYIAAVVFVLVEGALVYSVYRFRAKKNPVAAQIHGNTQLEVGWTVGAAVVLVILTVVTFAKLGSIINPPNSSAPFLESSLTQPAPPNGKELIICVQGRQYIWRYVYGAACRNNPFATKLPYSYQEMYVPADTTVVLSITASDVIHSWWVPSLGGKVDAVPGLHHLHLVQGKGAGALSRPVRTAVRPAARLHDRACERGVTQSVSDLADAAAAEDRDRQLAGDPAARVPHEDRKPLGDCRCQ